MYRTMLLLSLLLGTPLMVSAQVSSGDRIRLKGELTTGRYDVVALNARTIQVRDSTGSVLDVQLASVDRLDVYRGRRSTGRGFLRGAGIGGAAGASAGLVTGLLSGDDPSDQFIAFTAEEKALVLGVLFGGTGALVGGVIGMIAPGEHWERVDLESALTVGATADGVRLSYTYRF